jgi:hypothetical protein
MPPSGRRQRRKFGSKWGFYYFSFDKKIVKYFVQCYVLTQSLPGRHPVINIQSSLCTTPDLCKNVSLTVLYGSNGNSYTSVCGQKCAHIHIFFTT